MPLARKIADQLGPDSWLVRRLRPIREWTLAAAFDRRGLLRTVNGIPLRVLPRHRWYFAPNYDVAVAKFFAERIHPGDVCLNIGANLGVYALQFAHWSAPSGRVFAFEPNPDTAKALWKHVGLNGLTERVEVIQQAVSDRPGTAMFHAAGVSGMSRLGEPNPGLSGQTVPISVQIDTLDAFCERKSLRPSAIMIDVEGFEGAVLAGSRSLFANHRPSAVVVEMHPNAWEVAGYDRQSFERLLSGLGVRAVPLSGQNDPMGEYGHVCLEAIH